MYSIRDCELRVCLAVGIRTASEALRWYMYFISRSPRRCTYIAYNGKEIPDV